MNPLANLPQILIGKLGRSRVMILAWFKNSKMTGLTPGKAGFQERQKIDDASTSTLILRICLQKLFVYKTINN